MAQEFFLKIDSLKGESQKEPHKEETELLAWSWGMSNAGSLHIGGAGGGTGKATFQDISFTKYVDKTTPTLIQQAALGTHYKEAILTCRKTGGDKPIPYLVYKFTDVIVTSVSQGGSGGEDVLTENVTLNFREFKVTYTSQDKEGGKGAPVEFGYNIAEGAKV